MFKRIRFKERAVARLLPPQRAPLRTVLQEQGVGVAPASPEGPSIAAGYGLFDLDGGEFSREWCALWDLTPELLPEVRPAHSIAGALDTEGATMLGLREGIPVTVGSDHRHLEAQG